jgi:signal transduction histidine kinase
MKLRRLSQIVVLATSWYGLSIELWSRPLVARGSPFEAAMLLLLPAAAVLMLAFGPLRMWRPAGDGHRDSRRIVLVPTASACLWFVVLMFANSDAAPELALVHGVSGSMLAIGALTWAWSIHRMQHELMERVAHEEAQRWRLEAQLLTTQKLEALGMLAGGVAHDVNNVLASASAALHLVRRRVQRGDDATAELDDADRVLRSATRMTERLLGLAHNRGEHRRAVDVGEILDHVVRMLQQVVPPGVVVRCDVEAALPPITVEPCGLEHALLNLGLNARDALAGRGGTIALSGRRGGDAGRHVVVEVVDDGPGISAAVLPRVFEPFFTTKPVGHGTGLGLAMVEAYASDSGGTVTAISASGAGATFRLTFPAAEPSAGRGGAPAEQLVLEADADVGRRKLQHVDLLDRARARSVVGVDHRNLSLRAGDRKDRVLAGARLADARRQTRR